MTYNNSNDNFNWWVVQRGVKLLIAEAQTECVCSDVMVIKALTPRQLMAKARVTYLRMS